MLLVPNKVTHFMYDLEKWKAYSQAYLYRENITISAKKAYVILWVKMQSYKESGKGGLEGKIRSWLDQRHWSLWNGTEKWKKTKTLVKRH